MKKSLLAMTALAAMLFAGCTSSDEITTLETIKQAENAPTPISFGTYMGRTGTRTGAVGTITTDGANSTVSLQTEGFGVFAFHTAGTGADLSYSSTSLPNFMYNEHVYWDGSSTSWTYSPIKYWPNEAAANSGVDTKTGNGATTTSGVDKVSFFAYAPYVALSATPLSGSGITAINGRTTSGGTGSPADGNQKPGDPTISYTVGTIGKGVDLCWGVVPTSTTYVTVVTEDQTPTVGLPNLNLIKQEVSEKVEFLFKHALTKVRFTIQAAVNQAAAGGTLDGATKIFVNSVAITGSASFPVSGDLNLNNTTANTPKWENTSSTAAPLNNGILNTNITSSGPGVLTSAATAVFSNTNDWYYLIPGTSGSLTINCNYNVETTDEKLNGGKSTIVNDISKTLTGLTLEPGKAYTINIVLGLTSVDFNATVADWVDDATVVNLPLNYAAN